MAEGQTLQIITPTLDHLPGLIVESKGWFDEMGFCEYGNGWDLDIVTDWWKSVIQSPTYEAVIAIDNQRIVGAFVCFYKDRHFWHKGPLQACEMVNHTAAELPRSKRGKIMINLFYAMMEKIKQRGADYCFIGYDVRPNFSSYGKFLERKGFVDTSHVMMAKVGDL